MNGKHYKPLNIKEIRRKWFISVLEYLNTRYGLTQADVADYLEIRPTSISQMKKGVLNVNENIINKLRDRYDINEPNYNETNMAQESTSPYETENMGTISELQNRITELETALKYAHEQIETLKEFNEYLKKRNT